MGRSDVTAAAIQEIRFPSAVVPFGYQDLHQSADGMSNAYATRGAGDDDVSDAFLTRSAGISVAYSTGLIMPRNTPSNPSACSWGGLAVDEPGTQDTKIESDKSYFAEGAHYLAMEQLQERSEISPDRTLTPDSVRNPCAQKADRICSGLRFSCDASDTFAAPLHRAPRHFDTTPIPLEDYPDSDLYGDSDVDADIVMPQNAKRW
jgi:hypothetical protein